jgi:hypothetical protein
MLRLSAAIVSSLSFNSPSLIVRLFIVESLAFISFLSAAISSFFS